MVASRPPLIYPDNAVWPFDYLSLLPNGQGLSEVDSGGLDLLSCQNWLQVSRPRIATTKPTRDPRKARSPRSGKPDANRRGGGQH
jgi:hypothetical protein